MIVWNIQLQQHISFIQIWMILSTFQFYIIQAGVMHHNIDIWMIYMDHKLSTFGVWTYLLIHSAVYILTIVGLTTMLYTSLSIFN